VSDDSPLLALGISLEEQLAYEFLLGNPASTAATLARDLGWPQRRARSVLRALEVKSLANHLPDQTPCFVPTPPDVALELLTTRRNDELQRARSIAAQWPAKVRRATSEEQPVEIITGREAISSLFQNLHRSARSSVVCLERLPYVVNPSLDYFSVQKEAMARGVVMRNIVDASVLEAPGKVAELLNEVADGEDIRVLPSLPMKMVVVDHATALIPLTLERARDIALVLRQSLLLDALCELFEIFWERAVPFGTAALTMKREKNLRRSVDADRLATLLAAGMNDKSIAQELGISARTLERRLLDLFRELDARTRFQAGWQAALRSVSSSRGRGGKR
jgi:sugar-specific transcriptional regulator TrmB